MSAVLRSDEFPSYETPQAPEPREHHEASYPSDSDGGRTKWLIMVGIVALLGGLAYMVIHALHSQSAGPRQQVVKIAVLPDTPPPPPPKEEKKPEEKQDSKPQQQDKPKPVEAPPAPQQLKMDGPAGDGPSAFAAGSVNNEYKGGEIGTGMGGLAQTSYARAAGKELENYLRREKDLRPFDYKLVLNVWLNPDGSLRRAELAEGSGNKDLDAKLMATINHFPGVDRALPDNMAQPMRLKVSNRPLG